MVLVCCSKTVLGRELLKGFAALFFEMMSKIGRGIEKNGEFLVC